MPPSPSLTLHASLTNLHRVALIRLIVIAGQLSGILFAYFWLDASMDYTALLSGVALMAVVTALTFWRLRGSADVSDGEFFVHLLCDIGILTLMLYYSGGITNPFVSYYLVPICIAAALLGARLTAILTGLSLGAHTLLLFHYQPIDFMMPSSQGQEPHLHLVGMWCEFAISASLIGFFVNRMATALRTQQVELNLRREEALRQQQLVSVATLAAGTAHELGTPLSTMTLLLDDMIDDLEDDNRNDQALSADLNMLRRQVEGCRNTLRKLVATAETHQHGDVGSARVRDFVHQALDRWQVLRPMARYRCDVISSDAAVPADPVLEQALLNLLNNAADAQEPEQEVDITIAADDKHVVIEVLDRGSYRELPSQPFISTKPGGLGLGLLLSRAAAERYGGTLHWLPRPQGGTIARLTLPIIHRGDADATGSMRSNHAQIR